MPKFAANLSMMFNEVPFLDRFAAAADCGFTAVEYLFPYEHPAELVAERLQAAGLAQALFNMPPGDWAAGERGAWQLCPDAKRISQQRSTRQSPMPRSSARRSCT